MTLRSNKYTFKEFIAALESDDFDNVEDEWLEWAEGICNKRIEGYGEYGGHEGDCTNQPHPCFLCMLEGLLADYKEYFFNEEEWRKEQGV